MKLYLTIILFFITSFIFSQNNDHETSLEILKKVFTTYEIKSIEDQKVFETKVWEKHASIPLGKCYTIEFNKGITALAFNIYLADDPNEYRYMLEEGIENMIDVDETNSFQGGSERLIQVIFYDQINDKFLGKGNGFPLSGFSWIPGGMGDLMEINEISSFEEVSKSDNTCILNIVECPDCLGGLHYIFKYHNGNILSSKAVDGCFSDIIEENNKLFINLIINCYESEYYNESPKLEKVLILKW